MKSTGWGKENEEQDGPKIPGSIADDGDHDGSDEEFSMELSPKREKKEQKDGGNS